MVRTEPTHPCAESGRERGQPTLEALWAWLGEVPDPEIPVVSIVDLGIVRDARWSEDGNTACITVTPTYSGCPATEVIATEIRQTLLAKGIPRVELNVQLAPPWTTDWMTERARQNLLEYGIAPPSERDRLPGTGMSASLVTLGQVAPSPELRCPRCGSARVELLSRFGSTPCKSLHRCLSCLEPFDHFKCH